MKTDTGGLKMGKNSREWSKHPTPGPPSNFLMQ